MSAIAANAEAQTTDEPKADREASDAEARPATEEGLRPPTADTESGGASVDSTLAASPTARLPASLASAIPAWLPWTFAGLGAANAVTSFVAWRIRESHVDQWNSPACLEAGKTRVQACSNEYYGGRDAEAIAWVTGIGAVAFIGSAVFLGQARASVSASSSAIRFDYSGTF